MLEFIRLLRTRYQAIAHDGTPDHQVCLEQLLLAEAVAEKGVLLREAGQHALQLAVIGPTQAGKSSLVNLLLGCDAAEVSPLAGYTVHPQGFVVGGGEPLAYLQSFFGDFQQARQQDLRRERYRMYALTPVPQPATDFPAAVVWDTPDFDSIDAADYREGVLKTVALADALVLLVSKEKYADQSVWDMMALLQPLKQPTLVVLNKLSEATQATVLQSLQDKWRQARQDPFPEVLPLPYRQQGMGGTERQQLLGKVRQLLAAVDRRKHPEHFQHYLGGHWQHWLQPVRAEHAALREWQGMLQRAQEAALQQYRQDYLDHPHHYETFQSALVELLALLELPGLARFLAGTRQALTWPLRKLLRIGQARRKGASSALQSHEVGILRQIAEHQLIQLSEQLLDKVGQGCAQRRWWEQLGQSVRRQRSAIMETFGGAALPYHDAFQPHVEAVAHRLYHKLQEQPFLLNGLRATRIGTDAAALALALHTGGIGLHDLIIAPAMLSLTSLLAESSVGGYMHKLQEELKQAQLLAVREQLFDQCLQTALLDLAGRLEDPGLFNISEAQVLAAEGHLKEKKHGLRILGLG